MSEPSPMAVYHDKRCCAPCRHAHEKDDRPTSSDQLSTSTANSGSRHSFLSSQTSLSSRSSIVTQFPGPELPGGRPASASTRAYWCTSCDTEFKRKFDWKRHEDEFHERYKKYPCPDCNRVFWGANTFNQHHKTRHNCKTCPHADKVIKYTRKKRAWACGFCAAFLPSMDRYIDHIGLHYEAGRTKAHWYHSNVMYGLLHQPGVNTAWKDMIGSRFNHLPKDQQPRYGWDPKTTGRKQGFLENETVGNLQDLLEFFDPTKDDPSHIARLALDMAQVITANQAPGRSSLDMPEKPPQPPPPPKREKSSKRSHSGTQKELVPLPRPPVKERPVTQWPGVIPAAGVRELPGSKTRIHSPEVDVPMPEFDATAVPQPLFASSVSPPPNRSQYAHTSGPSISISTTSDPPPYATSTTSYPGFPRDTVVELLNDYMAQDQLQVGNAVEMPEMPAMHMAQDPIHNPPPFGQYEDWNSICSTMVDDVASPRGASLPLAPHEQQQSQHVRRSDVWAGPGDHMESMYVDNVQACDIAYGSMQDAPPLPIREDNMRRSDVWASTGPADYEGLDYEQEIAPPPPHTNWL
ncbi:PR domain zinc finger protein 5 [Cytospora mali]|uniref:PR domain zinc finger protein 5 n=1 Tax=Cytospora mali TaxID=578113 RepID=A0A194V518_CYTMA|nr:PR domain zinc finger protein 5 [Valsa mali var. pyri (nom. inval.)]